MVLSPYFTAGLGSKIGSTTLHEYGHNLGAWHANSLECGTLSVGGGSCSSTEYSDPLDVMGNSSNFGQPNAVHKDLLKWLTQGRLQVVPGPGTYTINAFEDNTANLKVLKIPRTRDSNGNINGYYYLEYRKPPSIWGGLPSSLSNYSNGIIVHISGVQPFCTSYCGPDFLGAGGGGDSELIDTHPNSGSGSADLNDAPLLLGEIYSDLNAGVSLNVTQLTSTSAMIQVTLSPPQLSVQTTVYPAYAGTVNGVGTYIVGQQVTLTASANPGYQFIRWRENRLSQSYPSPYVFSAISDRQLEAVFGPSTGAPPNDNFPGWTVAALPSRQSVDDTLGATTQAGEPTWPSPCSPTNRAVPIGRTVWYSYTPSVNGTATISTSGSSFDTVLAVYTGNFVGSLTLVGCSDDANGSFSSLLSFGAIAGTNYWIQAGGYDGASGSLIVDVTGPALLSCTPRPSIRTNTTVDAPGRLQVSVTAGVGASLTGLQFGNLSSNPSSSVNALIDVGGQTGRTGRFSVGLPAGSQSATFYVRRAAAGQAVTVPLVVTDLCGSWPTFVGAGPVAFEGAGTAGSGLDSVPTVAVTPSVAPPALPSATPTPSPTSTRTLTSTVIPAPTPTGSLATSIPTTTLPSTTPAALPVGVIIVPTGVTRVSTVTSVADTATIATATPNPISP